MFSKQFTLYELACHRAIILQNKHFKLNAAGTHCCCRIASSSLLLLLLHAVLTPVVLSAIKTAGGPLLLAPGAWMTVMAVLSCACAAALLRLYPHANAA
jgi:hypothetical protein